MAVLAGQRITGALLSPSAWSPLGTLAGYTVNVARYRSCPLTGSTELDISVTGGGANAASVTFSVTMPGAFALNNGLSSTAYPMAVNGTFSGGTCPRIVAASSGTITIIYVASHSNLLTGQVFIPTS